MPMLRFLRRRRPALLRLPAVALLLLAVLANPVLASLGDLHELGNGSDHLHAVSAHGDAAAAHGHADGDEGEGDLLHALMHASHCCGHLTAIVPAPLALPGMPPASAAPVAATVPVPAPRPALLLRPPIVA